MSSLVGIVSESDSGPSGPTAALVRSRQDTPHFEGRFPLPLKKGDGTPHPARRRAETLGIGESAAGDSPSPSGRGDTASRAATSRDALDRRKRRGRFSL